MERTGAQMIHAGAPKALWGEFTMAMCHILNLSPSSSIDDMPLNLWAGPSAGSGAHQGDISFLRVLGCQAFTHIPKSQRRKLDPDAISLMLVGYESAAKAYRLWDPETKRIVISRHVVFNESCFPMRRKEDLGDAESDFDDEDSTPTFIQSHPPDDTSQTIAETPDAPSGPDSPTVPHVHI